VQLERQLEREEVTVEVRGKLTFGLREKW